MSNNKQTRGVSNTGLDSRHLRLLHKKQIYKGENSTIAACKK